MIKPYNWTALQQRVDFVVDGRWAEPVVLIPWIGGNVFTPAEQRPDPNRKILKTTGIFVTPGAKLVGESGRATGGSGGGFNTQLLEQEVWLSVTNDKIGDVTDWVQYDRVYFLNRDRFYNISYVEDSATLRPNIHLIREHDIVTGDGDPVGQVIPVMTNSLYFDWRANKFYRATTGSGPPDPVTGKPTLTSNDWLRL